MCQKNFKKYQVQIDLNDCAKNEWNSSLIVDSFSKKKKNSKFQVKLVLNNVFQSVQFK